MIRAERTNYPILTSETATMGKMERLGWQDSAGCRFLDDFSFETLLAPLTAEEFRGRHFEQTPRIWHRHDPNFYDDLFSLKDFDRAVARSPSYVKIAEAKSKKNRRNPADNSSGLDQTLADMRSGATLVLDGLQARDPKLGLFCRMLEQELGHHFQTNLYLTPPHGQGFTPHWDNHCVLILQVLGSKHWKIEKTRRTFPHKGIYMSDEDREIFGEPEAFTLEQGDMIYIPSGFVHAAECGAEPSLHITVGLHTQSWDELLHAVITKIVANDDELRRALPLGFLAGSGDALATRVQSVLREATDAKFLAALVDEYRDELVKKYRPDVSGQVSDFFAPVPLTLEDTIAPRRASVYQLHQGDDIVRVNFGSRSIAFLGIFREALDFALNTPVFAIQDLPGEIEDEERLVFIERLLQEGLVVRKSNWA